MDLISFEQIPPQNTLLRDNPSILNYHRPPTVSLSTCIKSMTKLHCETANFWTHFVPTIFALLLILSNLLFCPLSFFKHDFDFDLLKYQDKLFLSIGLQGVCVCFGTSSIFHVFSSHINWNTKLNQFDLMGIVYMNTSLSISFCYFKLYNNNLVLSFSITSLVVIGTVSILIVRALNDPRAKGLRVLILVAATFFLSLPSLLSLCLNTHIQVDMLTKYMFASCIIICAMGGIFYATKIPEILFPGYFDLIFSSHMLMHVCTAVGVFVFYEAVLKTAISAHQDNS